MINSGKCNGVYQGWQKGHTDVCMYICMNIYHIYIYMKTYTHTHHTHIQSFVGHCHEFRVYSKCNEKSLKDAKVERPDSDSYP